MKLKQNFAPKGLSICIGIGTENGVNKILPPSTNLALCRLPAATALIWPLDFDDCNSMDEL